MTTEKRSTDGGDLPSSRHDSIAQVAPEQQGTLSRSERLIVAFAVLAGVLAVASANTVVDLDLFHQMALFREIWNTAAVPTGGTFAYTPTLDPVVHHEWGTGAVHFFTIVKSGLGHTGLMILKYLITFAICFACYFASQKSQGQFLTICLLAPVAICVGGYTGFTNVRAQMFTLLFLAIQFWMIGRDQAGCKKWIWVWPIMILLWCNLHGGVVAGLGIFGIYTAWRLIDQSIRTGSRSQAIRQIAHLFGLLGLAPLLLCINPWGTTYIPYLIRAVRMKRELIGEWLPIWHSPNMSLLSMYGVAVLIWLVTSLMIVGEKNKTAATKRELLASMWKYIFPIAIVGLTAILAARHIRHVSIFAVTWICFVPGMLAQTELRESLTQVSPSSRRLLVRLSVAVAMIAMAISFNAKFGAIQTPEVRTARLRGAPLYPVSAMNFLQEKGIQGNMMVPFAAGAYVSWRMYPKIKVSIDSRYEAAYPEGAVEESVSFYRAWDNWEQILDRYPTDFILVPTTAPICKKLAAGVEDRELPWHVIYRDASYLIYGRTPSSDAVAIVRAKR